MLKQVRGSLKKVAAWFVIALLVLAFGLWGVPELRTFTQRPPLRVGKTAFSSQAILAEYNRQMTARRNEAGGDFDREDAIAQGLGDDVVSSLVTRSLLDQEAERMGLVIPRELVRDYLHKDERFQNPATGKFDEFVLQSILANNQLSPRQFEELIRQELLREQLVGSIVMGPPAPKEITDALILREIERRRVGYLTITDDMAGVAAEPTPDALAAYYEENKAAFMAPEYRTFSTVTLKSTDFASKDETPEEELRKVYEANKARLYDSPERRTRHQLTFETEPEAQAAAAALKQGKPFENVATEKGFTLDQVTFDDTKSDVLDPAVADAVFAPDLQDGAVIGPVKGIFGWAVIQLAGITPPSTKTFEEVRDEIAAQYTDEDVKKRLFEAIEHIEEARDTGSSLASAAEAAGYKVVEYGPVDATSLAPGGGIIPDLSPEMLEEAFRLQEGDESDAIELSSGDGYFFVQVNAVTPPAARAFEAVSDEVESRWRRDERKARIEASVKQVTDSVAAGKTLEEASGPFNRAVLVVALDRNARQDAFSPALIEAVFKADKGAVVSGAAGSAEAQTIVEIKDVGFARSQIGPGEEAAFSQFLSYQLSQEMLEAYIAALREDHKVRADNGALAQIFSEGQ